MSPFKLMCRYAGYGMLLTGAFTCYLFVTSQTVEQQIMSLVVCVLLLLLSVAVSFYFACKYQMRREQQWVSNSRQAIHQPLRADFEVRVRQAAFVPQRGYRRNS